MAAWRVYTRSGDKGDTGLLFGGRVKKTDPRVEAYGAVDEAVSALGLARALTKDARVRESLARVQRELFDVGAELATDPANYQAQKARMAVTSREMSKRLERQMDEMTEQLPPLAGFILPGASPASAALDMARSVTRRAERRAVRLEEQSLLVNPEIVTYLNRLSDFLFILARYEERDLPREMVREDDANRP